MSSIFDYIAKGFTKEMKKMETYEVYNLFADKMSVKNTMEAKQIFAFIGKLQKTNDYLLNVCKSERLTDNQGGGTL